MKQTKIKKPKNFVLIVILHRKLKKNRKKTERRK